MLLKLQDYNFDIDRDLFPFIKNGIVIDTSVLKLIIDGIVCTRFTKKESAELKKIEDFLDYIKVKNKWNKFFITPHVLTETCNHIRNDYSKTYRYKEIINEIIPIIADMSDKVVIKDEIIQLIDLKKPVLEIGDISIFVVADEFIKKNEKIAILANDNELNTRYIDSKNVLLLDYKSNLLNLN